MPRKRFDFAMQLVKNIGSELKRLEKAERIISYKTNELDLVTQFDLEIQEEFVRAIIEKYPSDTILAEEKGLSKVKPSSATWIIDPIDGTANFAHGLPLYCISLAYYENSNPVFGLIYSPKTDELFSAFHNDGAFLNDSKIMVSRRNNLKESIITIGTSTLSSMELLNLLHENVRRPRVLGTAALQSAFVAAGYSEAFIGYRLNIWDIAAAYIIVKEAGGKVTDWSGKEITPWETEKMLFSNGLMHKELCSLINTIDF
ncbi:hypothetical protein AT15_07615 [Kosmotoga arenicorallina S304]|uniref:Inositol-1-monophosphatase n=1 Tax=Kosmotoga arenicorallina S304 TaxID=1453497 RepID=A0A182C770_9BACT|nr:inositol monophosphatase family protein [Kosmotoga arenicorallina]OAA31355.1 hypothetical protein AT15_07615 [Kosmotoga arenicorallina S304]